MLAETMAKELTAKKISAVSVTAPKKRRVPDDELSDISRTVRRDFQSMSLYSTREDTYETVRKMQE